MARTQPRVLTRVSTGILMISLIVAGLPSCGESPTMVSVIVPTGFHTGWQDLPHRVSQLEMTLDVLQDPPVLTVENDGGDFGAIDKPIANIETITVSHPNMIVHQGQTELEITAPQDFMADDAHQGQTEIVLPSSLNSSANVVVFLRGFRIDTDKYETDPAFSLATELPYDPALGFTTSGIGIEIGSPVRNENGWLFTVKARNRIALGDREDMNKAAIDASSWFRVDYLALGFDSNVVATEVTHAYTMNYPEFGSQTEHPHADAQQQKIAVSVPSSQALVGYGLRGFNLGINVPGQYSTDCIPEREELNFEGKDVGGPGRYLKEMTARVHAVEQISSELVNASLDLHISNSSLFHEIGNICFGGSAIATLIHSSATDASYAQSPKFEVEYKSGESQSIELLP